jgi:hypothetical protein
MVMARHEYEPSRENDQKEQCRVSQGMSLQIGLFGVASIFGAATSAGIT